MRDGGEWGVSMKIGRAETKHLNSEKSSIYTMYENIRLNRNKTRKLALEKPENKR